MLLLENIVTLYLFYSNGNVGSHPQISKGKNLVTIWERLCQGISEAVVL